MLVAITEEELQSEAARIEEERKVKQKMFLEAAAAEAGLTAEEYEAEQAKKREEAEIAKQRRIQERKEEQAMKMGHQGYPR